MHLHRNGLDMQGRCKRERDRCDLWLNVQFDLIAHRKLMCRRSQFCREGVMNVGDILLGEQGRNAPRVYEGG